MSEHLLIRIAPPDHTGCTWTVGDGAVEQGTLADVAPLAARRRAIVLVPGTEVLLTHAAIPATKYAKARAAAPWVVEDRLLSDVQEEQLALGHCRERGMWPMAIMARQCLDAHLDVCRAAGFEPAAVIPEPLALPSPREDAWSVLEEPGRVTVRTAPDTGFACEPEMLALVAAACEQPASLDRYVVTDADSRAHWPSSFADAVDGHEPTRIPEALAALEPREAAAGIDLLQGEYDRQKRSGKALRRWRVPALLGSVLIVALAAEGAIRYVSLGNEQRALRDEIETTFRQAFPEVERIVNPRAQAKTALAELRDANEATALIELLARAGRVLKEAQGVELARVTWRSGTLELELGGSDLQNLDTVKRRLREAGLQAHLTGANSAGDRVSGQIRVLADGES